MRVWVRVCVHAFVRLRVCVPVCVRACVLMCVGEVFELHGMCIFSVLISAYFPRDTVNVRAHVCVCLRVRDTCESHDSCGEAD